MIVPMKRITLLCLLPEQGSTVDALRDLGVIHVTPVLTPDSEDLERVQAQLVSAREVLGVLESAGQGRGETGKESPAGEVIVEVKTLMRRSKECSARMDALEKEAEVQRPFGNVSPDSLRRLSEAGVKVALCQLPPGEVLPSVDGAVIRVLGDDKGSRHVAVISLGESKCPGREIPWPERSLEAVETEIRQLREEMKRCSLRLTELSATCAGVRAHILDLEEEERFLMARDGMGTWERVSYLQGYCAEESVPELREEAARHGWGLLIREPGGDEEVPTLLRSPRWARPIKAVFDLIGILPGYRELDVSAVFLLFYSVFFAMLVSDAGYGILFLVLTMAISRLGKRIPPEVPKLLGVLSGCTILWGVLTGSYFGISIEALPTVMKEAAIPWMRDESNLMQLCFLIGAVHLSLAHGWALIRLGLCLGALAQAGWIAVTWVMYYLAMNMILGRSVPGFVMPLFLGGVAAVALFMTPFKALKAEWPSHMMLPLTVVGNFGDVVSYVRLFAVGSAGTAISVAFNEMAVGGGVHGVGDGLMAALILFLAHGLNILLAGLAVIVHGVRLNTLEFSGHLGMQWTGVPFKPFQRENNEEVTSVRR